MWSLLSLIRQPCLVLKCRSSTRMIPFRLTRVYTLGVYVFSGNSKGAKPQYSQWKREVMVNEWMNSIACFFLPISPTQDYINMYSCVFSICLLSVFMCVPCRGVVSPRLFTHLMALNNRSTAITWFRMNTFEIADNYYTFYVARCEWRSIHTHSSCSRGLVLISD